MHSKFPVLVLASAAMLAGCTVHPRGESVERAAVMDAGTPYARPVEERHLPTLAADASRDELVAYAFLSNAALEQRYWEWRAALEQVPQEGTQKTGLMLSFTSMITDGSTALADTTLAAGNDPMNNLVLRGKLQSAATIALDNARAAGWRFDKARFELRSKVLTACVDYAQTGELIHLAEANADLLQTILRVTESRVSTGGARPQDVLKAANELETAKNDIAAQQAKLIGERALLNTLLNRAPDAPLSLPSPLSTGNPVTMSDAEFLDQIARHNPELRAQLQEIAGRREAIIRARQEYLPDFGVSASTDIGGITQALAGSIVLPYLRYQAVDAGIRQARANLHAAEAMRRQAAHDLAGEVTADLATLRDAERQVDLLESKVLPRAEQIISATQTSYANGQATLLELLDAQRALVAIRQLIVEMRSDRERRFLSLQALGGIWF